MSNLTLLDLSDAKAAIRAEAPKSLSIESPEGWADIFTGLRTASGKVVTREQALRCGAFLTGMRILTEDVGSLPCILKKKTAKGAAEAVDHPLYRLLKTAPNPYQTPFELREHIIFDLLTTGKMFCYVPRDEYGMPTAIFPLDATTVALQGVHQNGDMVFTSGDPAFPGTFTHQQLWRSTLLNHGFIDGRSITLLAREAIGLALAAEEQGARLFTNGVQTDLALEMDETLGDDEKKQLREALQARQGGASNAWFPLLCEGGIKAKRIGLTAQESQYIEARHYQLADIARTLRIPGVMMGIKETVTYASASEMFLSYAKHTITPWCVRLEQTAERDLLQAREQARYSIRHQLSALLRADQKTRFEGYKIGIEGAFMQPAQAREEEGWDEVDGLDFNIFPANYAVVKDGKIVTPQAPDGPQNAPKTPENPPKMPQNPPQIPEKSKKAAKLADSIAASILRSEAREFARMSRKTDVSEAQAANFAAWHVDKIMELTGASGPAARSYSDWRFANRDAEEEARQRLVNLCLEGEL